ncbi:MAG: hypothetical protein NXY57DRAFT_1081395 [Lentinula lateritia]|uniref:Uncharacterized protein n=1 Tax=Lentinula lateritia TaxID=40482 RepID=A0ABQ8VCD4_9AGAR|nr:MAG: hypothetical protein NXY57DRAFT_1081395 [Lentinula lateritia]KAJ4486931.1 hypothetical protein C8R41DRAFT_921093 [Lentinula lateritia]
MSTAPKNAEFAHLFELFEKLASRRTRATDIGESPVMDDTHILSIPLDLQPVFRNLATLVTPRTISASGRRGRRNTVAVPSGSSDIDADTDTESVAKFPMGKQYPFKFKMMLHKLYELDDWGKKVREVLERSQKEYKPLAETVSHPESGDNARGEDGGVEGVHLGIESGVKSPRKRTGRPRGHTVTSSSGGTWKETVSRSVGVQPRDDERTVKKRCVGRRKSMNGLIGDLPNWVFNATVASSEINERVDPTGPPTVTFYSSSHQLDRNKVPPRRRVSSTATTAPATVLPVHSSHRYGALQQDGRKRVPPRRRVSSVATPAPAIEGGQLTDDKNFKKRRATSIVVVKRS